MAIKEYIQKEREYLIQLRRWFHQHPEPSLKEYETCKKIEEELDRMNIEHTRVGETGVYARIVGKQPKGKVMALRADIDALAMEDLKTVEYRSQNKGYAHACGHDAHAATLLTVAKVLQSKKSEFGGEVRLFFQQAEEIGQGARQFVQAGLMEGVTRVFGAHVSSSIESGNVSLTAGPQNASCDYFKIQVHGKGAHVSTPHLGVDALYIASMIVVQLQSIVARNSDPTDTVVVGVGVLNAGTQYNIIAEHAQIEGTTRSFSKETREKTNALVEKIAKETAAMYGAEATVEFKSFAAPLVNDETATKEAIEVAKKIVSMEHIHTDFGKKLGADDFADFLEKAKGVYAFVGTRNKEVEHSDVAHHHGLFDLDEEALLLSCNLYVDYTLETLK